MQLSQILEGVESINASEISPREISDISYDSRKVVANSLFVAIRGFQSDGHQFIQQAVEKGAIAVIAEEEVKTSPPVPLFVVRDSRLTLAKISANFFHHPTQNLRVIGITGTNGKTTISYLAEAILQQAGYSPAVLGTINYRHQNKIYSSSHTTPESYEIQQFAECVQKNGAESLVMEVSSHALDLKRVDFIEYDVCLFTNLTPEHLDYHKTIENYFQAKKRLFEELLEKSGKKNRAAILNLDDPFAAKLVSIISQARTITFSLSEDKGATIYPLSTDFSLDGIRAEIQTPWGKMKIKTSLLGKFNLSNILGAIGIGGSLGISLSKIEEALSNFTSVPGRLERVLNDKNIFCFVDYAHTPDALKNVIRSLREISSEKILVLFGCGGDRDSLKRPLMGEEVASLADWGVVTSDNPRTEDPNKIIEQILPGLEKKGWMKEKNFIVEPDRKEAIRKIVQSAQSGNVILIAGKGHEDYQILGKQKIHFDDREIAGEFLK